MDITFSTVEAFLPTVVNIWPHWEVDHAFDFSVEMQIRRRRGVVFVNALSQRRDESEGSLYARLDPNGRFDEAASRHHSFSPLFLKGREE